MRTVYHADEIKADLLLMDEAAGRKVAQNMNLPITGSIGIFRGEKPSDDLEEEETQCF